MRQCTQCSNSSESMIAELYGYGTVIGTGNAVMAWYPQDAAAKEVAK